MSDSVAGVMEQALRAERARIVASLIRVTGDWALADDCLQDAVEQGLVTWPRDGVPGKPGAWLTTAARRRAIDVIRRRGRESKSLEALVATNERSAAGFDAGGGYGDDRLRLLFACCHPGLSMRDRVALTLRTVSGLSTRELARLFLVSEAAMGQRLRRARMAITADELSLAVPPVDQIDDRVAGVLAVIYLVFTEGYAATDGCGVRDELADEAIVLAQLATWLLPEYAEAHALRGLLLLQHTRRPARLGADGEFVPLEEQDRDRWDQPMIAAGLTALGRARTLESPAAPAGQYRALAEIAARHSTSASPGDTDWAHIVAWYDALLEATGSPIVELNRAIALAMRDGPEVGLAAVEATVTQRRLNGHPNVPAIRADLLRRAGRTPEAVTAYREALSLARTEGARLHLARRLRELESPHPA